MRLGCDHPRCQHVAEADPTKQLGPDTVRNRIDYLRAVLRRVDMDPKRSLAKGGINHLDDSVRHRGDARIRGNDRGEALADLVPETRIGTSVIFSSPSLVIG